MIIQMYDYKRRETKTIISSAMQRALHCTCSLKFTPSLFPPSYSVLQSNLTTVAIFLNLSLIVDCSDICILLCLQNAVFSCHLIFTSSVCTLSVYFMFVTSSCSRPPLASENLFVQLVADCLILRHISHLILCLWLIFV